MGTAFIVCAEQEGDMVSFRSQRDGFFEVEYGEFAREMLTRAGVNYIQKGDSLYVVGRCGGPCTAVCSAPQSGRPCPWWSW